VGTIVKWTGGYGFIQCDALNIRAFFDAAGASECADYLSVGVAVRFELAFNLRGPVAHNLNY
jgi:hypothetical protein